jgi:hypothetical protein
MSQDTFPFADGEDAAPFVEEGQRNRKALFVAGGVVVALVVAAVGYLFLGGGSDSTDAAFVAPHVARPAAVAPGKVAKPVKKLPAPYKQRIGRDPFKALYVLPVSTGAGPGTSTGTSTATTSGTGTTTPTTSTTGATTPTTPSGTTTGSTRYTLKLVSISKPSPEVRFTTWKVGTDSKTVIPAQRFGKYGEIVVLAFSKNASGVVDKAIIQVGDDSPIDVAVGESVSVL